MDDSILIVPGAYARLENISEEGTWLQDEKSQAGDKLYERKKGEKVGVKDASMAEVQNRKSRTVCKPQSLADSDSIPRRSGLGLAAATGHNNH